MQFPEQKVGTGVQLGSACAANPSVKMLTGDLLGASLDSCRKMCGTAMGNTARVLAAAFACAHAHVRPPGGYIYSGP